MFAVQVEHAHAAGDIAGDVANTAYISDSNTVVQKWCVGYMMMTMMSVPW